MLILTRCHFVEVRIVFWAVLGVAILYRIGLIWKRVGRASEKCRNSLLSV